MNIEEYQELLAPYIHKLTKIETDKGCFTGKVRADFAQEKIVLEPDGVEVPLADILGLEICEENEAQLHTSALKPVDKEKEGGFVLYKDGLWVPAFILDPNKTFVDAALEVYYRNIEALIPGELYFARKEKYLYLLKDIHCLRSTFQKDFTVKAPATLHDMEEIIKPHKAEKSIIGEGWQQIEAIIQRLEVCSPEKYSMYLMLCVNLRKSLAALEINVLDDFLKECCGSPERRAYTAEEMVKEAFNLIKSRPYSNETIEDKLACLKKYEENFVEFLGAAAKDIKAFEDCLDQINVFFQYDLSAILSDDEDEDVARIIILRDVLEKCWGIIESINASQMVWLKENLVPELTSLETYINGWLEKLIVGKKPKLNFELQSEDYDSEEQVTTLWFRVTNGLEAFPAYDLVVESIDGLTPQDYYISNSRIVYNNSAEVRIKIKKDYRKLFSAVLAYNYETCTGRAKVGFIIDTRKEQAVVDFASARFKPTDQPIDNKFAEIANSAEVVDPDMVYGREEFLQKLEARVSASISKKSSTKGFFIWGQKRSGKSTVMYHLQKRLQDKKHEKWRKLEENGYVFDEYDEDDYIDIKRDEEKDAVWGCVYRGKACLAVPMFSLPLIDAYSLKGGEEAILSELKKYILKGIERTLLKPEFKDIAEALEEEGYLLSRKAKDFESIEERYARFWQLYNSYAGVDDLDNVYEYYSLPIVIFVDEFTLIYKWIRDGKVSSSFLERWNSLFKNKNMLYVAVGQDYLQKLTDKRPSAFAQVETFKLPYLEAASTRELIQRPVWNTAHDCTRFTREALDHIVNLTAGSPFYTVIFCNFLVDYMNQHRMQYADLNIVDKFLKETIKDSKAFTKDIFDSLYNDEGEDKPAEAKIINYKICQSVANNEEDDGYCSEANILPDLNQDEDWPEELEEELSLEIVGDLEKRLERLVERNVLQKQEERYKLVVGLFSQWLKNNS